MKRMFTSLVLIGFLFLQPAFLMAQNKEPAAKPTPGLLSAQELKQLMPPSVFFAGQSAPVQMRNSAGFRSAKGAVVLVGLVDSSGYSSGVAQKYQAYLLTEATLDVEGKSLPPGAYGVGFLESDVFNVMDIGGNDVFSATGHSDPGLHRAVPLKLVADAGGGFRLYFGKRYVVFSAK